MGNCFGTKNNKGTRSTISTSRRYNRKKHSDMLQIDISAIGNNRIQITSETIHSLLLEERTEAQEDIWPLRNVFGTTTAQDRFFTSILKNKGKLVCDGSCKHHETSSAFLTTDIPGCGGTNIIPGRRKEQTPYRAELGGILGGILYTNEICNRTMRACM